MAPSYVPTSTSTTPTPAVHHLAFRLVASNVIGPWGLSIPAVYRSGGDGGKTSAVTVGYWSGPNGQAPAATLYSAILREIKTRGKEARFKKSDRGQFVANG